MPAIPRPRVSVQPTGGTVGRLRVDAPVEGFTGGAAGLKAAGSAVATTGAVIQEQAQKREAAQAKLDAAKAKAATKAQEDNDKATYADKQTKVQLVLERVRSQYKSTSDPEQLAKILQDGEDAVGEISKGVPKSKADAFGLWLENENFSHNTKIDSQNIEKIEIDTEAKNRRTRATIIDNESTNGVFREDTYTTIDRWGETLPGDLTPEQRKLRVDEAKRDADTAYAKRMNDDDEFLLSEGYEPKELKTIHEANIDALDWLSNEEKDKLKKDAVDKVDSTVQTIEQERKDDVRATKADITAQWSDLTPNAQFELQQQYEAAGDTEMANFVEGMRENTDKSAPVWQVSAMNQELAAAQTQAERDSILEEYRKDLSAKQYAEATKFSSGQYQEDKKDTVAMALARLSHLIPGEPSTDLSKRIAKQEAEGDTRFLKSLRGERSLLSQKYFTPAEYAAITQKLNEMAMDPDTTPEDIKKFLDPHIMPKLVKQSEEAMLGHIRRGGLTEEEVTLRDIQGSNETAQDATDIKQKQESVKSITDDQLRGPLLKVLEKLSGPRLGTPKEL